MKPFRYALDPLCLLAIAAYIVGRCWVQRHVHTGFWHNQFTDVLLIPAALPLLLWVQRRLGLRRHDQKPDWREVTLHFVVWAIAAETVAPHVFHRAVGDWRDVIAYGVGAVMAGGWWALA